MKVFVIIPTYNRKECLKSLLHQIFEENIEGIELIITVVIDGSTDGTIEMLKKEFPTIQTVYGDGTWWYTRSIYEGIRSIAVEDNALILLMNDDIVLFSSFLHNLIIDFNSLPSNSILGAISLTAKPYKFFFSGIKKVKKISNTYVPYYPIFQNAQIDDLCGIYPSVTIAGRAMLFSIDLIKRFGNFDLSFKQYGSDEEFCFRTKKYGNVNSFISYNAKIVCKVEYTGKGTLFRKQGFYKFFMNNFNPYSPVYIVNALKIIWKYQNKWFFPISIIMLIGGRFKSYVRYNRNFL